VRILSIDGSVGGLIDERYDAAGLAALRREGELLVERGSADIYALCAELVREA
jgi:hypothetical protein